MSGQDLGAGVCVCISADYVCVHIHVWLCVLQFASIGIDVFVLIGVWVGLYACVHI